MALVPSEALVGGLSRVEETLNNRPPRLTSASHAHINTPSFRDGWVTASAHMVDHSHHQAGYRYAKFGDLLLSISEQKNDGRERGEGRIREKQGKSLRTQSPHLESPVLIATDTSTLHQHVYRCEPQRYPQLSVQRRLSIGEERNVAGLNASRATNLIEWRSTNGPFKNRQQILKVKGIGKKSFEQCAGFVRIQFPQDSINYNKTKGAKEEENPLDRTWIHPETYSIAKRTSNGVATPGFLTTGLDYEKRQHEKQFVKITLRTLSQD
uniref:HHH domain-containing protein n=1 Tax=Timema tahoe TaxID=61484 RepID=A0A7R9IFR9_9NEOP|nr:unnamed protein product [Timema tahoe]